MPSKLSNFVRGMRGTKRVSQKKYVVRPSVRLFQHNNERRIYIKNYWKIRQNFGRIAKQIGIILKNREKCHKF